MAKENADRQILDFAVRLDNNEAIKAVAEMSKGITALTKKKFNFGKNFGSKELEAFQKTIKESTQDTQALRDALEDAGKFSKKAADQGGALAKRFDAAKKAAQQLNRITSMHRKNIRSAEKQGSSQEAMDRLQKTAQSDMKRARAEVMRANRDLTKASTEKGVPQTLAKHKANQDRVKNFAETWDWHKTGEDIGGGVSDTLSAMKSKDLGGIAKGVSAMVGGSFKAVSQKATSWAAGKNTESMAAGKGPAGGAAGGILQMANKMSGLVGTLAKLGPILGMASAFFVGIVKLVLDIEAQAKKFNKELLETASTAEILADNMGDSQKAGVALGATLKNIRSSAFDWKANNAWGISAEDHKRVLNTLTSEGVSLRDLETQFENTKQASADTSKEIANFADVTHMSIAYSRLFGVSLDQITQFQAEMMTELGQSLDDTQLQFARMDKAATESGISANKFFGIIRSVSADLSLYHTRLEDVVSTLKTLGRVMSPKNAQKYLQMATQGLKNMGEADRMRLTLLADKGQAGYSKKVLQEDVADKSSDLLSKLASQIGGNVDEASTLLKGGTVMRNGMSKSLDQLVKDSGQYREAYTELEMDKGELSKGGQMGVGVAAANASVGAQFDLKSQALKKFGGGGKLKDMTGMNGFAARQVTGVSQEEFRSMAKMEAGIDAQRQLMKRDHKLFANSGIKVFDKNRKEVPKPSDAEIDAAIEAASTNKILQSMSDKDAEAFLEATKQKDFAKETSDHTFSMLDKLENIFDALFNYIYNVLVDIWEGLSKAMPSFLGGKSQKEIAMQKEVMKSRNPGIHNMWNQSNGDAGAFKSKLKGSDQGKSFESALSGYGETTKKIMELQRKEDASDTSKEDRQKYKSEKEALQEQMSGVFGAVDQSLTKGDRDSVEKLAKTRGMTEDQISTLLDSFDKGLGVKQGLQEAGANEQFTGDFMSTLINLVDPEEYGKAVVSSSNNQTLGSTPGGPAAGTVASPTTPAATGTSKALTDTANATQDTANSTLATATALKTGVPLASNTVNEVGSSVLDSIRKALFEYYMYKDISPASMFAATKDQPGGFNASNVISNAYNRVTGKNAAGGVVTGIGADGIAMVTSPAPGEGLASIGAGETIVPAGGSGGGGGGGNVQLNFNGSYTDGMKEMLRREVPKLIYEYKKREKYT